MEVSLSFFLCLLQQTVRFPVSILRKNQSSLISPPSSSSHFSNRKFESFDLWEVPRVEMHRIKYSKSLVESGGIKNGLSVLLLKSPQKGLLVEKLVVSDVGGVSGFSSSAAMGSRRFFNTGGGGGGGGGGITTESSSLVKRDMFPAADIPILFSGRKTRECVGGFVPHPCNISHMLPYFARALASSSTSQSSGQTPRQESKKKKKECQTISSFKLQRERDDEISSTKVSLNQFPGLMVPHSPQFGLTHSEIIRRRKTRCLLCLNPGTGYFEKQQDVAAAANHHSHDELQVPYGHVCRGSAYGWLFLTDDNLDMKLLNPFSGEEIQLPPVKTLPPSSSEKEDRWPLSKWFVRKAVFSANPSVEPRPVVLVIYGGQHIPRLAFCKPGDKGWTPLEFPIERHFHQDAIYHKGQFYVLSYPGYVAAFDIGRRIDDDDHSVKITLVATPPERALIFSYSSYLVVVDGELVRVQLRQACFCDGCIEETLKSIEIERKRDGDTTDEDYYTDEDSDDDEEYMQSPCVDQRLPCSTYGIKIRRLDVSKKQWVKVESLGDKAVFVGYNTSFALSASDYPDGVCIPDSIYFTFGEGGNEYTENVCYDMGIYNVKDKSVKPLYPPMPIDGVVKPAPIWIVNAADGKIDG